MSDLPDLTDFLSQVAQVMDEAPFTPSPQYIAQEKARCTADPIYFIERYVQIYDNVTAAWIAFKLWPAQKRALQTIIDSKYTVILKARQEGLTWLAGDAYAIWQMLFRPIAEVLVFSQRDTEAKKLLERVKGSYERLPVWLKEEVRLDNTEEFRLRNGSGIQALTASAGGRSNAATYVVVDEADFVERVQALITAAKPTIDAGQNKMVVLSTVNDDTPGSYFQRLYKAAKSGDGQWTACFLSWRDHPGRTDEWYAQVCADALHIDFTLDKVYREYPETDLQALAPRSLNKRYAPQKIAALSAELQPLVIVGLPDIEGLRLYVPPQPGHTYGIGVDPAEGLLSGDDSYAQVLDGETFEQCAVIQGKIPPEALADSVYALSVYFNRGPVLFELNNHGHAFLLQARRLGMPLLAGLNRRGEKEKRLGWLTTKTSKHTLYDGGDAILRAVIEETADENGNLQPDFARPILHDFVTSSQLSNIDKDELEAPEGEHDDAAVSWVLAVRSVYQGPAGLEMVNHNLWDTQQAPIPAMPGRPLPTPPARIIVKPLWERQPNDINRKLLERGIVRRRP